MSDDLVKRLRDEHVAASRTEAADRIEALEAENARLRYVLEGVRGAIDTGRHEPLMIWRDQIAIALEPDAKKDTPCGS